MTVTSSGDHVFGRVRPSHDGDFQLNGKTVRVATFRDLPPPTGAAPYRLDLRDIIPASAYDVIVTTNKLVFHFNGDIGGIDFVPRLQQLVAAGMEADCYGAGPAYSPFLVPGWRLRSFPTARPRDTMLNSISHTSIFPLPIFAVPGNHDGENLEGQPTLDGFVRNFCAPAPGIHQPEAGDAPRTAMTQPNVYWTLLTPLVNIVGLYSNVPDGGEIQSPQTEWLVEELQSLPADVPIIVTSPSRLLSRHLPFRSPATKATLENAAATVTVTRSRGQVMSMITASHEDHGRWKPVPYL
jgi:hypothetical protein